MVPAFLALSSTPPNLTKLEKDLTAIAKAFRGRLGYCVVDLTTGKRISFNGEDIFPTASTIKTSVALEALCEVDEGQHKMTDKYPLLPTEKRQASMWTYLMKDGTSLDIDGYVNLMIGVSDNTATMTMQDFIGSKPVNQRMEKLGLLHTKILGHRTDRDNQESVWQQKFGWGMTTPREQARLYELLYQHKAASPAVCEKLLRILSRQYWDDITPTMCPIDVKVCSKTGSVNQSRSEVAIVYASRPYVLAMYTADQQDQRWVHDNDGLVALRAISKLVWNTFEPSRPFELPKGYDKFAPTGGGA
ncbi:MAG: serine hydrolase [Armatimonadetes bacterium]|nr:serine hydrolase [Armatimonadota bacterium]